MIFWFIVALFIEAILALTSSHQKFWGLLFVATTALWLASWAAQQIWKQLK